MEESPDDRLKRLEQKLAIPSEKKTPDQIESDLDQNWDYQLSTGPDRVMRRKEAYQQHGLEPPTTIAKPGTKEVDEQGPVRRFVRPVLEGGGAIGGGVLGAPLGPVGAAIGGVLGYAGGDTLASALERFAGERPPLTGIPQAGAETLHALTGGGVAEMTGRLLGRVAGGAGSAVLAPFAKQYTGENRTLAEAAKAKGIELDPHEILQSRPLALGHKVLENIPFTSGMIQRKELDKLGALTNEWQRIRDQVGAPDRKRLGEIGQEIQGKVEKELDRLGVRQEDVRNTARDQILQAAGSPLTYRELGEATQQAVQDRYDGLKAVEKLAWDHVRDAMPNQRVLTPNMQQTAQTIKKKYENMPSFLDEPLGRQLDDAMRSGNPAYDKAVSSIPDGLPPSARATILKSLGPNEQPGWTMDSLLSLRSAMGDAIRAHHTGLQKGDAAQGSADVYGKVYTDILKSLDKDIQAFSNTQGSDFANRLALARSASGERLSYFNPKENPYVVKAIQSDPSRIAETLIKPGSAAGFTALKDVVGEHASAPVKQAFTNKLLKVGGQEGEGLAGLRRTLDQYGAQTLAEVYSPQEVKDLYALANRADWMKRSPIGNPFFRELAKSSPQTVAPTILENPELVGKMVRSFGPSMKTSLRQAFVEGLKPRGDAPFPTTLMKQLNAYPADVQKQLFTSSELKDFYDLAKIVERTRGTVKLAENPSGTAQNLVTFTTAGAILKHPLVNAPSVIGTAGLAKLYLSQAGRKWLLEGLTTPVRSSRSVELAGKLSAIAGIDAFRDQQDAQRARTALTHPAMPAFESAQ